MALERILEPEVMDSPEEARDYNAMDHAAVNELFVADLLSAGLPGDDVLDLGTGTALIPVELCQRHPSCRVMAVDAAVYMLDLARFNLEKSGLTRRIELRHVDAKALPFPDQMFDAVISNSIIHHIPEPDECLREAVRVVRADGLLYFRDLLRPGTEDQLDQLVATYAGGENEHSRQLFRESLHAALSLADIRGLVTQLGFSEDSVRQTSDRHWTWSTRTLDP